MVKKWDDNNLLDTLKKHSQLKKCGILKLWKFKNLKFQECFTTYKWGIINVHDVLNKVVIHITLNSNLKN
jgi:hypothetical protein